MLDKIEIKGYKSIKELSLEIEPINILIGSNGSGKSNLLSFFSFLENIYKQNLQRYVALQGGVDKFLHKGSKQTSEISAKVSLKDNAYSFRLEPAETGFIFIEEGAWYYNHMNNLAVYTSEAKIKTTTSFRIRYIQEYLESIRKYHFHDTGPNSPFTRLSNLASDRFILYEDGRNLAAFLYEIRANYKKHYNFIIRIIQSVAPYFSDFYLEADTNGNIGLFWKSKYSSTIYSVNDFSDGTLRFIALTVLFMQPNLPSTIIIDEPELGLHPFAINKLSALIKSAAKKGTKIILATQSTDLISHFEPEDIVTVDLIEGASKFQRLSNASLEKWLADYTIDDLWKRNIITSGHPNI